MNLNKKNVIARALARSNLLVNIELLRRGEHPSRNDGMFNARDALSDISFLWKLFIFVQMKNFVRCAPWQSCRLGDRLARRLGGSRPYSGLVSALAGGRFWLAGFFFERAGARAGSGLLGLDPKGL